MRYVNSLHVVDPVCPFVLVPDGHAEQLFESCVAVYVFSAHASQLPLLPALRKDPGGQARRSLNNVNHVCRTQNVLLSK